MLVNTHRALAGALCALGLALGGGCATPAKQCAPVTATITTTGPASAPLLAKYARWIPAEAEVVGIIDVQGALDTLGRPSKLLPAGSAKESANGDAAVAKLRADLGALTKERLKIDVTKAKQAIVWAAEKGTGVILVGLKANLGGTRAIGDLKAAQIAPNHPADQGAMGTATLWAVQLPDALVVFPETEHTTAAGKQKRLWLPGKAADALAADAARMKQVSAMIAKRRAPITIATTFQTATRETMSKKLKFSLDGAVVTIGRASTFAIYAESKQLDAAQAQIRAKLDEARAEADRRTKDSRQERLPRAFMGLMFQHGAALLSDLAAGERTPNTLSWTVTHEQVTAPVVFAIFIPALMRR